MKAFFKGKAVVEIARDEDGVFTPNDFKSWLKIRRKVVAPRLLNTVNDFKSLLEMLVELKVHEQDVREFYKHKGSNTTRMYIKGSVALHSERGLCSYVDTRGWAEFRALKYVAQSLKNKGIITCHIYPVAGPNEYHRRYYHYSNALWANPMRWIYLEHVINETKLIISELDK